MTPCNAVQSNGNFSVNGSITYYAVLLFEYFYHPLVNNKKEVYDFFKILVHFFNQSE